MDRVGQNQQTEKATPRRIQKARDKGQFLTSRLLLGGVQFAIATTFFSMFAGGWCVRFAKVLSEMIRRAASGELRAQQLIDLSRIALIETTVPLAVGGMSLVALSLAGQLFVTNFGISGQKLAPDLAKLNPWEKVRGMARENTTSFIQGLVLIPLLLYTVFWLFQDNLGQYLTLPRMSAGRGTMLMANQIESLLWKASGAFLIIGVLDYVREKRRYMKGLKMSKQEIKDEVRTEGSAEMKGKIKRMQRSHHRRRMLVNVKTATAVVVNPTHYAVALRYDPGAGGAPVVVAKGKNLLALRIKAIAQEHYIPIIENPPLARGSMPPSKSVMKSPSIYTAPWPKFWHTSSS